MVVNLAYESTVERNILNYLNSIPFTKAVKWSQEGRQKGMPDIICVHNGLSIMIEVKRPGETQTLLQEVTMEEWTNVGTITMVAYKLADVEATMTHILRVEAGIKEELL